MQSRCYFMKTKLIGFSTWGKNDLVLANALWGNQDATRYIAATGSFSPKEIDDRLNLEIKNHSQYGIQCWPIFDLKTGEFMGTSGLRPHIHSMASYEISCNLMPEYQNSIYGLHALKTVISYAVNTLQAQCLFGGHHPENERCRRFVNHLGFEYNGDEYRAAFQSRHPTYILRVGLQKHKYFATHRPQLIGQLAAA